MDVDREVKVRFDGSDLLQAQAPWQVLLPRTALANLGLFL